MPVYCTLQKFLDKFKLSLTKHYNIYIGANKCTNVNYIKKWKIKIGRR